MKITKNKRSALFLLGLLSTVAAPSQTITGVWTGKINGQKVEIKLIQEGDSLKGSSYYYQSAHVYRRYSIKGYFDPANNNAVWWDDQLIAEEMGGLNLASPGKTALLATADFNCPGNNVMKLDGNAVVHEDPSLPKGEIHLTKARTTQFPDEWDFVVDNYFQGGNDREIIDSVELATTHPLVSPPPLPSPVAKARPAKVLREPESPRKPATTVTKTEPVIVSAPIRPLTIEEKFATRKKVFTREIPVTGDSIELRFYDNAEVDGDSISLFLNDRMIFTHIRLTEKAYTIRLAVADLAPSNELTMVAENLGSIPPNTSLMVAQVGEERYEARLESTEGSSAMIRLVRH